MGTPRVYELNTQIDAKLREMHIKQGLMTMQTAVLRWAVRNRHALGEMGLLGSLQDVMEREIKNARMESPNQQPERDGTRNPDRQQALPGLHAVPDDERESKGSKPAEGEVL